MRARQRPHLQGPTAEGSTLRVQIIVGCTAHPVLEPLARVERGSMGMQAYDTLEIRFARIAAIEDALGILQWDAETMMPERASEGRGDQLATLKGLAHELLTAPKTRDLIDQAADVEGSLSAWQRANLREMRRLYLHASAVPGDLVEANSRAVSRAEMVWRSARQARDFGMLKPHLAEVLLLQRQIGIAKGEALG